MPKSRHTLLPTLVCCVAALLPSRVVTAAADTIEALGIDSSSIAILHEVTQTDGELTQDMHRRFWAGVLAQKDDPDREKMRVQLARTANVDLARVRAVYLSMAATLKAGSPIVDPSYVSAQAAFENAQVLGSDADRKAIKEKISKEDRLFHEQLMKVARGEPLQRGDEQIIITNEVVDHVLSQLDTTNARIRRLLDPVWHSPAQAQPQQPGAPTAVLINYVIAGEVARTKSLVDYCEGAAPESGQRLQKALSDYLHVVKSVLVPYLQENKIDPDMPVDVDMKQLIVSTANSCVADARRFAAVPYCDALSESFHQATADRIRPKIKLMIDFADAASKPNRFNIGSTSTPSTPDVRSCGPTRIDTDHVPLK